MGIKRSVFLHRFQKITKCALKSYFKKMEKLRDAPENKENCFLSLRHVYIFKITIKMLNSVVDSML
jgi:hypothetical protein